MKLKQTLTNFHLVLIGNLLKMYACCGEGCMLVRPRQKVRSPWSLFFLDNRKNGWICEDFFLVTAELLLFIVVIIPCITFLAMTEHILMWAVIPSIYLKTLSVSRSLMHFLTFCNRTANFTSHDHAWIFWRAARNICLCFGTFLLIFSSAFNTAYSSN